MKETTTRKNHPGRVCVSTTVVAVILVLAGCGTIEVVSVTGGAGFTQYDHEAFVKEFTADVTGRQVVLIYDKDASRALTAVRTMSRSGEELGTHLEVAAREEDSTRQLFLFEPVAFREETGTFRIRSVYTDRYVVHDPESIEIPLRVSGSADDVYGVFKITSSGSDGGVILSVYGGDIPLLRTPDWRFAAVYDENIRDYGDQFLMVEHEADRSFGSRQIFIVATR